MNEEMIKELLRTIEDNTGFDLEQEPGTRFTTTALVNLVVTGIFDAIANKLGNELKIAVDENETQVNCVTEGIDYFNFVAEVREGKEDDNISVTIIPNESFTEDII